MQPRKRHNRLRDLSFAESLEARNLLAGTPVSAAAPAASASTPDENDSTDQDGGSEKAGEVAAVAEAPTQPSANPAPNAEEISTQSTPESETSPSASKSTTAAESKSEKSSATELASENPDKDIKDTEAPLVDSSSKDDSQEQSNNDNEITSDTTEELVDDDQANQRIENEDVNQPKNSEPDVGKAEDQTKVDRESIGETEVRETEVRETEVTETEVRETEVRETEVPNQSLSENIQDSKIDLVPDNSAELETQSEIEPLHPSQSNPGHGGDPPGLEIAAAKKLERDLRKEAKQESKDVKKASKADDKADKKNGSDVDIVPSEVQQVGELETLTTDQPALDSPGEMIELPVEDELLESQSTVIAENLPVTRSSGSKIEAPPLDKPADLAPSSVVLVTADSSEPAPAEIDDFAPLSSVEFINNITVDDALPALSSAQPIASDQLAEQTQELNAVTELASMSTQHKRVEDGQSVSLVEEIARRETGDSISHQPESTTVADDVVADASVKVSHATEDVDSAVIDAMPAKLDAGSASSRPVETAPVSSIKDAANSGTVTQLDIVATEDAQSLPVQRIPAATVTIVSVKQTKGVESPAPNSHSGVVPELAPRDVESASESNVGTRRATADASVAAVQVEQVSQQATDRAQQNPSSRVPVTNSRSSATLMVDSSVGKTPLTENKSRGADVDSNQSQDTPNVGLATPVATREQTATVTGTLEFQTPHESRPLDSQPVESSKGIQIAVAKNSIAVQSPDTLSATNFGSGLVKAAEQPRTSREASSMASKSASDRDQSQGSGEALVSTAKETESRSRRVVPIDSSVRLDTDQQTLGTPVSLGDEVSNLTRLVPNEMGVRSSMEGEELAIKTIRDVQSEIEQTGFQLPPSSANVAERSYDALPTPLSETLADRVLELNLELKTSSDPSSVLPAPNGGVLKSLGFDSAEATSSRQRRRDTGVGEDRYVTVFQATLVHNSSKKISRSIDHGHRVVPTENDPSGTERSSAPVAPVMRSDRVTEENREVSVLVSRVSDHVEAAVSREIESDPPQATGDEPNSVIPPQTDSIRVIRKQRDRLPQLDGTDMEAPACAAAIAITIGAMHAGESHGQLAVSKAQRRSQGGAS